MKIKGNATERPCKLSNWVVSESVSYSGIPNKEKSDRMSLSKLKSDRASLDCVGD
jgi:hypothetical protein